MEQMWRVYDWVPTCKWVIPEDCCTHRDAERLELPRVSVGAVGGTHWEIKPEAFPPEALAGIQKYAVQPFYSVEQAIRVAGPWLQLALVECGWSPSFIPRLGQRLTEADVQVIRRMSDEWKTRHIEWLVHDAAVAGAFAPGTETLRQMLEAVFTRPWVHDRLPDQYDACPSLWKRTKKE